MLSRSAENLYWMARYIERAGATARLIEMGRRMAMLPGSYSTDEWKSVASAAGALDRFEDAGVIDEAAIVRTLMLDKDNPSSIRACLERARASGRAVRTALTRDLWEALNDGWRTLEETDADAALRDLPGMLDWVKQRATRFRGAVTDSMLREDRYDFVMIGVHLERADMILRLLDVKYYVLLPETDVVGGGRDHHQWTSVLHATSAMRAYHHIYRGDYSPYKIADFMILNEAFPRSVAFSYDQVGIHLNRLARAYGQRHLCHTTASNTIAELKDMDMGEVFQNGLHEFVEEMLATTRRLHTEIHNAYYY